MEFVTIEKADFLKLNRKLDEIQKAILKTQDPGSDATWINNLDLCRKLKVSRRTLQKYREKHLIVYSQVGPKIFYKMEDVEAFMSKFQIKVNH